MRTPISNRVNKTLSDSDFASETGLYLRADVGFVPGTWSDQSGNGRDVIQPTVGKRPIQITDSNGFAAIQFDGSTNKFMYRNDTSVYNQYTVMIAFSYNNTHPLFQSVLYGNRPWGNGSAQTVSLFGLNGDFRPVIYQNSTTPSTNLEVAHESPFVINAINILTCVIKNNHRHIYINGYLVQADLVTQSNLSTRIFAGWIGGEDGATQFGGNIYRIAIWPTALDDDLRIISENVWNKQLNIENKKRLLIFDGNGMTQAIAPGNSTLVQETITLLNTIPTARPYKQLNLAYSGQTIENMRKDAKWRIFNGKNSLQTFLLIFGGHNDLLSGTDVSVIAAIQAYVNQAESFGFKVFVSTILPGLDISLKETFRQTINTFIRDTYDNVIDFASDPDMGQAGQYSNMTYYKVDQIHPNATGSARLATYISSIIKPLL